MTSDALGETAAMSMDMLMLLASVGLYVILSFFPAVRTLVSIGPLKAMGSRDSEPAHAGIAARPDRALANLQESLVMFVPLVLICEFYGMTNATSALGAQLFVAARVTHAICYLVGIPVLKSLAYIAGLVGIFMIAMQLTPLIG